MASLKPHPSNPRTHSPKQIRQIAESIEKFGFVNPILTDSEGRVIAGHGRIEGAKLLGIEMLPTIPLADLTEAQIRAYVLADNKLAENAGWNAELLALELNYIASSPSLRDRRPAPGTWTQPDRGLVRDALSRQQPGYPDRF